MLWSDRMSHRSILTASWCLTATDMCTTSARPLCFSRSVCSVTVNGFECAAFIEAHSLRLMAGDALSHSPLLLNDTVGHAVLGFTVHLGNASYIKSARFGPPASRRAFGCTKITTRVLSASRVAVNCTLGPGYGGGLQMSVDTCLTPTANCSWAQDNSTTFAFAPPVFYDNSIRVSGSPPAANGQLSVSSANSVSLSFAGKGFSSNPLVQQVYFGPVNQPRLFPCTQDPTTTDSMLVCVTPVRARSALHLFSVKSATQAGATGAFLRFVIDSYQQASVFSDDSISYPTNFPAITRVAGCTNVDNTTIVR